MIDEREILKHNIEMSEHANGAAQFLCSLIGGQYVTKEQTREAMDFLLASTKRYSYENGIGVDRDRDEANRLYHMAAGKNFGPAQELETLETSSYFYLSRRDRARINAERANLIVSDFYL